MKNSKAGISLGEISVIIPLYNGERTIKRVLQAILDQTAYEYIHEIIVVNDGSTDNSRTIAESFAQNALIAVKVISVSNGGVSKARNIGMKNSSGKWIALCDADDIWLPDKIKHQVEIINNNEDVDFLGGNHVEMVQQFLFRKIKDLTRLSVKDLCLKILPQTSTAIFKRSIFETIGGYDENQKYAEDGNFFMKIASKYGYYYDPVQVVIYGDGKRGFGDTGLSADIQEMHKGLLKNMNEMYSLGYIDKFYLYYSIIIENVKYVRRKWITGRG